MNGATSSGYSYRNNSDLNVVNDMVLQWDKWNKVEFEWTVGNCYDNGETTSNPLANCLTIRESKAGNIVDTYFIDDLSVKEITPNVRIYTSDDEIPSVNAVIGSMADIDTETAVLLVASYDAEGKMVELNESSVMDITKGFPVTSSAVTPSAKAAKYVAFLWDSLEGARPYIKPFNIVAKNPLDGKKFLFIGNSFTYYGKTVTAASQETDTSKMSARFNDKGYFYNICSLNGAEVNVTNWTWGGHNLMDTFGGSCGANRGHDGHDHLADLRSLSDMKYDYVMIQPGSTNTQEETDMIDTVMDIFKSANSDVKFVYVIPWRFYDQSYNLLLEKADELKDKGVIIADWGRIVYDIINGTVSVPGATQEYNKNTFTVSKSSADGYHPNMLTGYITSQTVYSAITRSPAYGQDYSFCTNADLNSHFDVADFLDTYYTYDNISPEGSSVEIIGDDLTTFPEVFKSESDMRGIQKLIDQYLNK